MPKQQPPNKSDNVKAAIIGGIFLIIASIIAGILPQIKSNKDNNDVSRPEINSIVRSQVMINLSAVNNAVKAKTLISKYEEQGLLTSGNREDFICQNQCYLIIFDNDRVIGLYKLLTNATYYDLYNKKIVIKPILGSTELWLHVFDEGN